ncbi:hypothetical protein MTO96_013516 [Rhipicephalus appendiculatus]
MGLHGEHRRMSMLYGPGFHCIPSGRLTPLSSKIKYASDMALPSMLMQVELSPLRTARVPVTYVNMLLQSTVKYKAPTSKLGEGKTANFLLYSMQLATMYIALHEG